MKITATPAHWPRTEREARAVQDALRGMVVVEDGGGEPAAFTGVDVAYDDERDLVAAAAVVLDRELKVVERATAVGRVSFPYVPGLLAFRELPTVLAALEQLRADPGLIVCDGYGLAHPRRFGLACHLGVLLDRSVVGVAKNPFTFMYEEPAAERGAASPLAENGETVGRALRTRGGVKPVFVSVGHRVELDGACAQVLHLTPRHRQPETTRHADTLCRVALREAQAGL